MDIHPFELLFDPPHTDPLPDPARAHIAVGAHGKDRDRILLSPECRSVEEVEAEVNELKKDLDRILKVARGKFARRV